MNFERCRKNVMYRIVLILVFACFNVLVHLFLKALWMSRDLGSLWWRGRHVQSAARDPGGVWDNRKLDLWRPPRSSAADIELGVCNGDLLSQCVFVCHVCSNKGNSRSQAVYGARKLYDCLTWAPISSILCCSPHYLFLPWSMHCPFLWC